MGTEACLAKKGNSLTDAILDALGYTGDEVRKITIELDAGQPIRATVEHYLGDSERLADVLHRTRWTATKTTSDDDPKEN